VKPGETILIRIVAGHAQDFTLQVISSRHGLLSWYDSSGKIDASSPCDAEVVELSKRMVEKACGGEKRKKKAKK